MALVFRGAGKEEGFLEIVVCLETFIFRAYIDVPERFASIWFYTNRTSSSDGFMGGKDFVSVAPTLPHLTLGDDNIQTSVLYCARGRSSPPV